MTGDWVLLAEMGATTVGSTAVVVVMGGRVCGDRGGVTVTELLSLSDCTSWYHGNRAADAVRLYLLVPW